MIYNNFQYTEITEAIIKAYYRVYNALGYGFLEKVYEKALCIELETVGLNAETQKNLKVYYDTHIVGDYFADLVVNHCVIVELKATEALREEHEAQLTNYLKASEIEVGLLLNFGKIPQFKRKVFENHRKAALPQHKKS